MDDLKSSNPLLKRVDRAVFLQIDKFKTTPNYTVLSDFYSGLEEEQQKVFKAALTAATIILPVLLMSLLWWNNNSLKQQLGMRTQIMEKSLEIIGQKESLQQVEPQILSLSPIDSDSMLTTRLSNILGTTGLDTNRVQVSNFSMNSISSSVFRSEADLAFTGFSTDEMVNLFTAMIQREKFRIESVQITRSPETNLLNGQFHAVHLSSAVPETEEE